MSEDLLIEVNNLSVDFVVNDNINKAVNNISFSLQKGKTLGIVGESGSGKSITSLSAMRLIPGPSGKITSGEILFNNKHGKTDLTKQSEKEMQSFRGNEIAMIFQEPMTAMNPVIRCGDQVSEAILLHQPDLTEQSKLNIIIEESLLFLINLIKPLFYYLTFGRFESLIGKSLSRRRSEARRKAIQLFRKVKLPRPVDIYSSYPHEISGGQKQRVMIALALSCNPSILIADEPTTALDVTVQKTIIELLKELQNEHGMGIIFISHDLSLIAEFADDVLVMYKGEIVEKGPIKDVFESPAHPYTRGLLACRPPLNKKLIRLPTIQDFMSVDSNNKLVKTDHSIKDVINDLIISEKETKLRQDILYDQSPLFEVKNLKKYFVLKKYFLGEPKSWVKAVDDVSFSVYPGETLGLVGESGCGKTTLGKVLLKLITATSGKIIFNDEDISNYSMKQMRGFRKDMQIIFQDPYSSLNPKMFIGRAIMEPMQVHGVCENDFQRKQEVIELLYKVGLTEDAFYRYPHEFSGGQRQRICIARALSLRPKFILCDESVSSLDVSVQAEVLNLLNDLRDEFGLTYIFISHDLSVVKFMSDRIMVMNQGKIIEEGFSQDIYLNPKKTYTKNLINSIPKGIIT